MNTYFSRYFEWQGVCRERWFHECIHNDLLGSDGMFVTKRAHQEYVHETFPFQHVDCYLNTVQVKQCSAYLLFRFCVDGREVSKVINRSCTPDGTARSGGSRKGSSNGSRSMSCR